MFKIGDDVRVNPHGLVGTDNKPIYYFGKITRIRSDKFMLSHPANPTGLIIYADWRNEDNTNTVLNTGFYASVVDKIHVIEEK